MKKLVKVFAGLFLTVFVTGMVAVWYLEYGPGDESDRIQVLLGQSEPKPDQFIISSDYRRQPEGIGYFAWIDGEVVGVTVKHILVNKNLILTLENGEIKATVGECLESSLRVDGDCLILQDDITEANMIRDVSKVPTEVSLYNPRLGIWMPFAVTKKSSEGFDAVGLMIDLDGDGKADMQSKACFGMSGSPLVESEAGVPVLDGQGRMIARGELEGAYGPPEERCHAKIFALSMKLQP